MSLISFVRSRIIQNKPTRLRRYRSYKIRCSNNYVLWPAPANGWNLVGINGHRRNKGMCILHKLLNNRPRAGKTQLAQYRRVVSPRKREGQGRSKKTENPVDPQPDPIPNSESTCEKITKLAGK